MKSSSLYRGLRCDPLTTACCGLIATLSLLCPNIRGADQVQPRGLPFIRSYPLDEIGKVPRGLRLGFDSFGRFAVMYDGIYSVLNDSAWVDRIDATSADRSLMTTIQVVDGKYFYCGRGSWGTVDLTPEGRFRAHSLVPPNAPAWTNITSFSESLVTRSGIYFHELKGVVYWDFARQQNFFFELPRVSTVFSAGTQVFVSCQDHVLREIHPATAAIEAVGLPGLEGVVVERSAVLDSNHTLLALQDGRLVSFDGRSAVPWSPQSNFELNGRITALGSLIEGGIAIAIQGKGLVLISRDGSLKWVLHLPEFRRVSGLAANEPGVLWAAGENAVHKIFYDSPVTNFGQELGLNASWPTITSWNDRLVVCSNSTLYEMEPATPGTPTRFKPLKSAPDDNALCVASRGSQLLVATPSDIYAAGEEGRFTSVIKIKNVAVMAFVEPDICVAIGNREIAALRFADGHWTECAPRIEGVGDAPIRSMIHGAVWIELGGDRVARLSYNAGRLVFQRVPLPWTGTPWTNVGAIGSIVVLSGSPGHRAFYDERTGALCSAPALDLLLNRSPYWIARITEDASGKLWATHTNGVVTFTPQGNDYALDATTFELRNDSYPQVLAFPDNNIWIISGHSLFHVEQPVDRPTPPPPARLVSLVADDRNLELQNQTDPSLPPPQFAFDNNSLSVRLFSGTYAWRYPPLYEYRLGKPDSWKSVDPGLLLRFPKLRDGDYQLEVRTATPVQPAPRPFTLNFVIKPPAYRTPLAYAAYILILGVLIVALVRQTTRQSLQRNEHLEEVVRERTHQLEVTMEKLNEETRNTATLAERSRLAGEIHDSLQQSLSGSILHLDTTMTHPSLTAEVHSRLDMVRRMMSYTREEIQQAVWNLQSPLLHNSSLGDALRKLAGFINSGTVAITVVVHGEQVSLDTAVQHNLLRIAQEAITNSVRHANPTSIEVALQYLPDTILLTITDNGTGFDPLVGAKVAGHFGLRGLHARAKSIKADLVIKSSPATGTVIQVAVPRKIQSNDRNLQNQPT